MPSLSLYEEVPAVKLGTSHDFDPGQASRPSDRGRE
jgi:hypothetical protein